MHNNCTGLPCLSKTEFAIDISLCVLSFLNIVVHSFGIHLLLEVKRKRVQHLYILALSGSEVSICIIRFLNMATRLTLLTTNHYTMDFIENVDGCFESLIYTGLSLLYYSCMILITVDRLMASALTVNYPAYWNQEKAKRVLLLLCVVSAGMYIGIETFRQVTKRDIAEGIYVYFYIPFDVLFAVTSITTYTFIFYRYISSAMRTSRFVSTTPNIQKKSFCGDFMNNHV